MINASMMWIADHPSNPWLEEYLKLQGWTVFKYGETKLVKKEPKEVPDKLLSTVDLKPKEKEFNAKDNFIQYLASKVKG